MLITEKGKKLVICDYKTKGTPADEAYALKYYEQQTNLYALMFEKNKFKVADFAIFSYWSPKLVSTKIKNKVKFISQVIKIPVDTKKADRLFQEAVKCLKSKEPKSAWNCSHCKFVENRSKYATKKI